MDNSRHDTLIKSDFLGFRRTKVIKPQDCAT